MRREPLVRMFRRLRWCRCVCRGAEAVLDSGAPRPSRGAEAGREGVPAAGTCGERVPLAVGPLVRRRNSDAAALGDSETKVGTIGDGEAAAGAEAGGLAGRLRV